MKSPPPLVLASTSPYRRELLARLKMPFDCVGPGVDESRGVEEGSAALVRRLAHAKARAVALRRHGAWVIGSDQVAVLLDAAPDDRVFGKPGSTADCIEQLLQCSGKTLAFLTAVAVARHSGAMTHDRATCGPADDLIEFMDTTRVTFRRLDRPTVERYVAQEAPLDCAGGFKSEGLGITLCDSIDSADPTALIGLPLIRLSAALRSLGFALP